MNLYLKFSLLIFFLLSTFLAEAQDFDFDTGTSKTFALIVGVSNYEEEKIPQLNFAHRDAEALYDYLTSPAGGSVPDSNIKLLTNEKANILAIENATYWLRDSVKEGDLAIFFFSGHGDVETKYRDEHGYLLPYDVPYTNYGRSALSLNSLDELARALSVDNKARTMIILDACRAGKLAGNDINGKGITAEQAEIRKANEVRILSCKPDQQSWESPTLGGGRGVFSYYLINGMIGLAESDNDGEINYFELSTFTKPKVKIQANKLSKKKKRQDPFFDSSNDDFVIAKIDTAELSKIKNLEEEIGDGGGLVAIDKGIRREKNENLGRSEMEQLADKMLTDEFLDGLNYSEIIKLNSTETVSFFIEKFEGGNGLSTEDLTRIEDIKNDVVAKKKPSTYNDYHRFPIPNDSEVRRGRRNLPPVPDGTTEYIDGKQRKELGRLIAIRLHTRGQQIVKSYLRGDTTELKKRKYYSENRGDYNNYADMFAVAMNMLPDDHPSLERLEIKHHYFKGVAARIQIPTSRNKDSLIRVAEFHQNKANELDNTTAFISNELANLALLKGDTEAAEKYYAEAQKIAPKWAIPYGNMAHLYYDAGRIEEAKAMAEKARKLQPDLSSPYSALGKIYLQEKNYLKAEEYFRRSSEMEEKNWFPFEQLGHVYLKNTEYQVADSFYYEADLRKKGLYSSPEFNENFIWLNDLNSVTFDTIHYEIDDADLSTLAEFARGINAYGAGDFKSAENYFRKVAGIENNHPLAYHFLGEMFLQQNRFEESEMMLKYGIDFHLSEDDFENYINNVQNQIDKKPKKYSVGTEVYSRAYQTKTTDYYLLGNLYKERKSYIFAEETYKKIIEIEPEIQRPYQELWTLYESIKRYKESEALIIDFCQKNGLNNFELLEEFYARMNDKMPDNPEWFYKRGILQYNRFKEVYAENGFNPARAGKGQGDPYIPIINLEEHFLKTIRLDPQHPSKADIYLKIAEVKLMKQTPDEASEYFEEAISLEPTHADPRKKAIGAYATRYRFQDALNHLGYLMDSSQINYANRLRYADYMIRASKFSTADSLLTASENYDIIERAERVDLYARLALNSGQYDKAIELYNKKIRLSTTTPADQYSIAKAKMQTGREKEAFNELKEILNSGTFNYPFVLRFDKSWDSLRENKEWKKMISSHFPEN